MHLHQGRWKEAAVVLTPIGNGESLRALLDLDRGANIVSLQAPDGFECLASGVRPEPGTKDFSRAGLRGYDDCFPTIAACRVSEYAPYPLGDHGNFWNRTWRLLHSTQSENGCSFEAGCDSHELGLKIRRRLDLAPASAIMTVALSNSGSAPKPFSWAGHLLLAVDDDTSVELDDRAVVVETNNHGLAERSVVTLDKLWPRIENIRRWRDVPTQSYVKAFGEWPTNGIVLRRAGRRLRIERLAGDDVRLGIWINRDGFPDPVGHAHLGIEPTLGFGDSLADSVARGQGLTLAPGETREIRIRLTVGDA